MQTISLKLLFFCIYSKISEFLLLNHIGFAAEARKFEMALDVCGQYEKKMVITGRSDGATGAEFADYVMKTIQDPELESKWQSYQ